MAMAYKKRNPVPKVTGTKSAIRPVGNTVKAKSAQRLTKGYTGGAVTGAAGPITKGAQTRVKKPIGGGTVYETPGFKPSTRNRKKF